MVVDQVDYGVWPKTLPPPLFSMIILLNLKHFLTICMKFIFYFKLGMDAVVLMQMIDRLETS